MIYLWSTKYWGLTGWNPGAARHEWCWRGLRAVSPGPWLVFLLLWLSKNEWISNVDMLYFWKHTCVYIYIYEDIYIHYYADMSVYIYIHICTYMYTYMVGPKDLRFLRFTKWAGIYQGLSLLGRIIIDAISRCVYVIYIYIDNRHILYTNTHMGFP